MSDTLAYLKELYPGHYFVTAIEAGKLLHLTEKTVYNRIANDTFPLRTFKEGKQRLVTIHSLAKYLDGIGAGVAEPEVKKRGRPLKTASKQ